MKWKNLLPAFGAGLLGAIVFWWATVLYLCTECAEEPGSECSWSGSCLSGIGIPLAVVLVAIALLVPYRLVERRWPWQPSGEE